MKSFFIIAVFFPVFGIAQFFPYQFPDVINKDTKKITYTSVVAVRGASKEQLYTSAKLWMLKNVASHTAHLSFFDAASGAIIGNAHFKISYNVVAFFKVETSIYTIKHTININTKDGRYKVEMTDFRISSFEEGEGSALENHQPASREWKSSMYNPKTLAASYRNFYIAVNAKVLSQLASLELAMTGSSDDDW